MLPSPRLFKNRWTALIWAGGILWTAADIAHSAPAKPTATTAPASAAAASVDAIGDTVDAADLAVIENAISE